MGNLIGHVRHPPSTPSIITDWQKYMQALIHLADISNNVYIGSYGLGTGGMIFKILHRMSRSAKINIIVGLPIKKYQDQYMSEEHIREAIKDYGFHNVTFKFREGFHAKYAVGKRQHVHKGFISNWNLHASTYNQLAVQASEEQCRDLLRLHKFWSKK